MKQKLWRHYKGNLYLSLMEAAFAPAPWLVVLEEGDRLSVFTGDNGKLCVTAADLLGNDSEIHRVVYTGSRARVVHGEGLVIYVGLYDNPKGNRLCARPLSEWGEMVGPLLARVPRFVEVVR